MIEARELRIGNWVSMGGKDYAVAEFGKDLRLISFVSPPNGTHSPGVNHPDVTAIPLSEEWLLKFGFEVETSLTNNLTANRELYPNRSLRIQSGFLDENGIENFWVGIEGAHISNCKYVHQLQNLYFALTGMELSVSQSQTSTPTGRG